MRSPASGESPADLRSAEPDNTHWLAPLSVAALVTLGTAIQTTNGTLSAPAIGYLTIAAVLVMVAIVTRRPGRMVTVDERIVPALCGAGLVIQILQLHTTAPGIFIVLKGQSAGLFTLGLAGLAAAGGVLVSGAARRATLPLVLAAVAVHFSLGVLAIHHSPGTFIDVDVFQRNAVEALRHGVNPYAITFPNIYGNDQFYGPGTSVGGRLQFGFPYFPLSLLVVMPGQVLAGDHRYAALVAMELAAVLMARARPGAYGALAAVLFLTTPRIFYVLEMSWTEPFVVLGLAAVVFAACRSHRLVPWLFGAFVALKQYLVFAIPAGLLLVAASRARHSLTGFAIRSAVLGLIVTAPFVLWNPAAFVNSVVTLQFRQPFRSDALSFLSWWTAQGHPQPSSAIAFVMASLVAALAIWRLPRTAAAFAATVAATFLAFFAFNKQAFCNYYFFVIGALATTLSACARVPADVNVPVPAPSMPTRTALRRAFAAHPMAALALAAAAALPLVWPGDAPFINDEPLLVAAAVSANTAGRLAEGGLLGTFGFTYGPLPVWIYQLLMALTHDLVIVAVLHAVVIAFTTAIACWWLSRALGLWVWFAPVPLLSPYFWFYSRVLWDNPFLIPLGAIAIAGYAAHLSEGSKPGLRAAVAAMAMIPLVHLMGIALVAPLATHMLVVRWRALWAERTSVATVIAVTVVAAWSYVVYLVNAKMPAAGEAGGASGWMFPLMGGRVLSARNLDYFYGAGPLHGTFMQMAAALSWIAYGLVWMGIGVAISLVLVATLRRRWTPRAHIAVIALAALASQMALDGFAGKFEHSQYYNGTWIVFTLFAWFAVDWVAARRAPVRWTAHAATGLLAAALLASVGTLTLRLHRTSGTREIYGPTLANQQRIARRLAVYSSDSSVSTTVTPYVLYPHALETLRKLNAKRYPSGPSRAFEVRYASPDPASGLIELVER